MEEKTGAGAAAVAPGAEEDLGKLAEEYAAAYLGERGYEIRDRNWRMARVGELDIVAEKDGAIVFVEVRCRGYDVYGTPEESILRSKRRKLSLTALAYLAEHELRKVMVRFDVIAVTPTRRGPRVEHFRDAFRPSFGAETPLL